MPYLLVQTEFSKVLIWMINRNNVVGGRSLYFELMKRNVVDVVCLRSVGVRKEDEEWSS